MNDCCLNDCCKGEGKVVAPRTKDLGDAKCQNRFPLVGWSPQNFYKFFLGTPLKLWASIGHWWIWHFDLNKYSEQQVRLRSMTRWGPGTRAGLAQGSRLSQGAGLPS